MIEQRNSLAWHKFNGILRYALSHTATKAFPIYIVNEYPKSGGSWVGEMLSDALDIPFPRNRLPMLCSSILHGHMMHSWNMHNVLIVWRDGRDVLISQYFHSLFENERGNARLVAKCRADLRFTDYENVSENLVPFMEYVYVRKRHPRMSWTDFVNKWADCKRCVHVRYEDLRAYTVEALRRIVEELTGRTLDDAMLCSVVDKYTFEKMSGRKPGQSDSRSFMRKGVVGDWKSYFDKETKKRFREYAGDALIKLSYEADHSWVDQ